MLNLIELLGITHGQGTKNSPRWGSFDHFQRKLTAQLKNTSLRFLSECEFLPLQLAKRLMELQPGARCPESLHEDDDHSITFVCMYKKKDILGAITVVVDSGTGLPSDESYGGYINRFRGMGRHIAEITSIALNTRILGDGDFRFSQGSRLVVSLSLLKSAVGYLKNSTKTDTIVTRFNRRHEAVYKAMMFRPLSGLDYYTATDKEVFPAFFLDLAYLKQNPDRPVSHFLDIERWVNPNEPTSVSFCSAEMATA